MKWFLYATRNLCFSFKSSKLRFFDSEGDQGGGGQNWRKKIIDFFHVSEHADHFKAIKVFSLRKNRKWFGRGVPPPPPGW